MLWSWPMEVSRCELRTRGVVKVRCVHKSHGKTGEFKICQLSVLSFSGFGLEIGANSSVFSIAPLGLC